MAQRGAEGVTDYSPPVEADLVSHDATVRLVRRIVVAALLACVIGLVATGIDLWFTYRPSPAGPGAVQRAHRLLSAGAVNLALVWVVLTAIDRRRTRPSRVWTVASAAGLALLVVAESLTGYLLPWDQIAYWSVEVGSDMRGMKALFLPEVRFVLLGGVEIGAATIRRWTVLHVVVLPSLLGAVGVATMLLGRRRGQPAGETDGGGPPSAG